MSRRMVQVERNRPRVVVIGCGDWGKNLVRVFHELGHLYATSDIGCKTETEYTHRHYVDGHAHCLNNPQIDAVAIATPSKTHYEIALAALKAGKDVFVEKPMTLRVRDACELVEEAEKRNLILMVGHLMLYHPGVTLLKAQLPKLGKIRYLTAMRFNMGKFRPDEPCWWTFAPHDLSMMLYLLGKSPDNCQENYFCGDVNYTFAKMRVGEAIVLIAVNRLYPGRIRQLAVIGEDGRSLMFDGLAEIEAEPLVLELEHFVQCIQTRERPLTDGQNGLAVVRVLENGARAMQRG